MRCLAFCANLFVHFLVSCVFVVAAVTPDARAGLIDTDVVLGAQPAPEPTGPLALRARDDLRAQLVAHGVDPRDTLTRVAALTDDEVRLLAEQIDSLPAGGDVTALILVGILVLLFTDILGLTDVYSFDKPGAR